MNFNQKKTIECLTVVLGVRRIILQEMEIPVKLENFVTVLSTEKI